MNILKNLQIRNDIISRQYFAVGILDNTRVFGKLIITCILIESSLFEKYITNM